VAANTTGGFHLLLWQTVGFPQNFGIGEATPFTAVAFDRAICRSQPSQLFYLPFSFSLHSLFLATSAKCS